MSIARDRANRSGTDPLQIDNTKLITDSGDLKVQDTSGNEKKLIADEIHVGTGSDKVILKRDSSTGKVAIQTQASGEAPQGGTIASTTVYATTALLPTSPSDGEQALVTANNFLYIAKSNGWYKIAEITNTTPTISSAGNASYTFLTDGTPVSIEITATDAEVGTALQYKYVVSSGSIGSSATVTSSATSGGTYSALAANTLTTNKFFKVTPSTNTAHAGTFSLTFSASDGVAVATSSASSFTLAFDVSGSYVFDGTGDYITIPSSSDFNFGTGAFSVECFYNVNFDTSGSNTIFLYDFGSEDVRFTFKSGAIRAQLGSETQLSYSIGDLDRNTFHHHALTRDGSGNVKLYHNGSEVGSYSSSTYNVTSTTLRIGDKHSGSKEFTGYISNFRILKGSLAYTPTSVTSASSASSSYGMLSTPASLPSWGTTWTLETWIYITNSASYNTFFHGFGGYIALYSGQLSVYSMGGFSADAGTFSRNKWHHIALVNNSGSFKAYIDGVQSHSGTANTAIHSGGSGTLDMMAQGGNTWPTFGYMADTRLVIGTAVYSGNFTPPVDQLTKTGGTYPSTTNVNTAFPAGHTYLLTNQTSSGTTIADNSDQNYTLVTAGALTGSTTSPYSPYFTVPTTPLTAVTNTKLLTLTEKEPSRVTNGSYFFSSDNGIGGSNARVITANDNNMQLGTSTDFTFECWYKVISYPTSVDAYLWDFGDGQWGWLVPYIMRNGYLRVGTYHGTIFAGSTSDGGAELNRWYHLAITREGSTFKAYLDGTLMGSTTQSSWGISPNNARISLGGYANTSYPNYGVKSFISDFRFVKGLAVYTGNFSVPTGPLTKTGGTYPNNTNRTDPSASQTLLLTANHNSGTPVDSSDSNRTLSVINTVVVGNGVENAPADLSSSSHSLSLGGDTTHSYVSPFAQASGGSVLFDGTNDNLSIPSFAMGTNNYTIEMWFNATSLGNYVHLYDGRGGSSGNAILIQLTNTGTVRFYSVSFRISGSTQVSANTWNHVALERVGNVNTLYLNGVSQGTYNDGGTSFVGPSNNVGRIGSDDSGSGSFFPGYISNFRIVIGSAVYNGGFTPPTSELTAITNTQILTCQNSTGSITDASSNYHTVTANGGAIATRFNPF